MLSPGRHPYIPHKCRIKVGLKTPQMRRYLQAGNSYKLRKRGMKADKGEIVIEGAGVNEGEASEDGSDEKDTIGEIDDREGGSTGGEIESILLSSPPHNNPPGEVHQPSTQPPGILPSPIQPAGILSSPIQPAGRVHPSIQLPGILSSPVQPAGILPSPIQPAGNVHPSNQPPGILSSPVQLAGILPSPIQPEGGVQSHWSTHHTQEDTATGLQGARKNMHTVYSVHNHSTHTHVTTEQGLVSVLSSVLQAPGEAD